MSNIYPSADISAAASSVIKTDGPASGPRPWKALEGSMLFSRLKASVRTLSFSEDRIMVAMGRPPAGPAVMNLNRNLRNQNFTSFYVT